MIHEILISDVELARGMIESGHSDPEILACLTSRSLDPAKAAQLVGDLRHGRKPNAQRPFDLRQTVHTTDEGRSTERSQAHQPPPAEHSHRKRSRSGKHKRASIPWWFVLLACIALGALGYVLFEAGKQASAEGINAEKHQIEPAPGK